MKSNFQKTLVFVALSLLCSLMARAQSAKDTVNQTCVGMGYIKAGYNPTAKAKPIQTNKAIAKFYEKQYLCIMDRHARSNWFYVKAVPFDNLCLTGSKGNPECLPLENKKSARWLKKSMEQKPDCHIVNSTNSSPAYVGNCPAGWVHRRYIHFIAG